MISNNIILIIFILIIIGIIVYFYYNYKNSGSVPEDNTVVLENNKKHNINNKRVRFNKSVKYNTYKNKLSSSSVNKNSDTSTSPFMFTPNNRPKIDVDSIFGSITSSDSRSPNKLEINLDDIDKPNYPIIDQLIDQNTTIFPSNLDQTDPEAMWDANFGLPLMSKNDKKKFVEKMQKNHKEYEKSLGQFTQYQMDNSTLIKTDVIIDPFKLEHRSDCLKGQSVKDIYDRQVAGPKAKPKKIKIKTPTNIVYEDESELNGGNIKGTNLHGFDGVNDGYKSAAFGNEF
jgi:hypothetical protein